MGVLRVFSVPASERTLCSAWDRWLISAQTQSAKRAGLTKNEALKERCGDGGSTHTPRKSKKKLGTTTTRIPRFVEEIYLTHVRHFNEFREEVIVPDGERVATNVQSVEKVATNNSMKVIKLFKETPEDFIRSFQRLLDSFLASQKW